MPNASLPNGLRRTGLLCGLVGLLAGGGATVPCRLFAADLTSAGVTVAEIDNTARAHLERADAFLANGQYAEAVDTLRRVMDEGGDMLVAVAPRGVDAVHGFVRFVPLREHCHQWLARLAHTAPEALRWYRQQVDPLAERWLRQAETEGERKWLERIVDDFYVSTVGDDALFRLGGLALQEGNFRAVREYFERTSPRLRFPAIPDPAFAGTEGRSIWWLLRETDLAAHWASIEPLLAATSQRPSWLAYPDTDIDLNELRARLVLVSILAGEPDRARGELEIFRRLAPGAVGKIGGRAGEYVQLLESLLEGSLAWPPPRGKDWTTFAGAPSRNGTAAATVDVAPQPIWDMPLRRIAEAPVPRGTGRLRIAEANDGLLSYFPLLVGDLVIVPSGPSEADLVGIDLHSGKAVFSRGDRATPNAAEPIFVPPDFGVPRYTATAHGQRLYLIVDTFSAETSGTGRTWQPPPGRLVGLDLAAERKLVLDVRLDGDLWGDGWAFEGPPLADGSQLYVALRRYDRVRVESYVASFDARQGRLLWRQFLCATETRSGQRSPHTSHNLLTLDEGTLYYNTNQGVVASLRARTGEIRWLTTYPRSPLEPSAGGHRFRDLTPCVVHGDLVLVAAADCERIFALDALTGHPLWMTAEGEAAGAVHLLGVGKNRVLAGGDSLYWFDLHTGRRVGQFPSPRFAAPGHARVAPRGLGRGILAGPYVYWPTRDAVYVLRQQTVHSPRGWEPVLERVIPLRPGGASGGNLLLADGVLLIAAADRLYAFNETGIRDDAQRGRRTGGGEAGRGVPPDHQ